MGLSFLGQPLKRIAQALIVFKNPNILTVPSNRSLRSGIGILDSVRKRFETAIVFDVEILIAQEQGSYLWNLLSPFYAKIIAPFA